MVRAETPAVPSFTDDSVVDRTAALIGGNATIFAYDAASDRFVRRTTNLKKENGERAVGTELAARPASRRGLRQDDARLDARRADHRDRAGFFRGPRERPRLRS